MEKLWKRWVNAWDDIVSGNRLYWRVIWSVWFTIVVVFLIMPLTNFSAYSPVPADSFGVALGVFGGLFASWSMFDAHAASVSSEEVLETLHSFRENHAELIDEFIDLIGRAESTIELLLPTPAYGFLFGQAERSKALCRALIKACSNPKISVSLLLVTGTQQKYLEEAASLGSKQSDLFSSLCGEVVTALLNGESNQISFMQYDPHVRAVIVDRDVRDGAQYKGICVLSFTQNYNDTYRNFESKGFRSQRVQLVRAVSELTEVYKKFFSSEPAKNLQPREIVRYMTQLLR